MREYAGPLLLALGIGLSLGVKFAYWLTTHYLGDNEAFVQTGGVLDRVTDLLSQVGDTAFALGLDGWRMWDPATPGLASRAEYGPFFTSGARQALRVRCGRQPLTTRSSRKSDRTRT